MDARLRPWLLASPWLWAAAAASGCAGADRAPASTFHLLDGRTLSLAELQGKVLLVNFWATTCASCVKEMPQLVQMHQRYAPRGFETLAVAMSYDPPEWVANFARTRQLPFTVALDKDGVLAQAWGDVKLTPTTFIVDRQGRIVKRYVGPPDFDALAALLERLLA
ncbi:MAG: TlpA disulfide reductase family protein [Tepidimonas sp.]|uniref:TlpA disulfide reductase family protein n=1 Tax=Tepidimonas sp. TaxID=2002775 RepID=UPI00298F39FD|nr:TlpA disulfide reductase family protein [Tepidimonas sp.]MDW8337066.1 TlpA disulfide reductase family protein [Tepidimonas sp.]